VTATGPEGTAWSCVRGGAAGGEGQGLHQRVVGLERAAQGSGHGPKCRGSRSVRTMLSDTGFGFWQVLCGDRGWTWWSLWVSSNSGYSVIFLHRLVSHIAWKLRSQTNSLCSYAHIFGVHHHRISESGESQGATASWKLLNLLLRLFFQCFTSPLVAWMVARSGGKT